MDRRAWQATVHRVAKSQTQMKQFSKLAHKSLQRGLCGQKSLILLSKCQWSWLLDQIVRICLKRHILHSHEPWMRDSVSPHPHQHLMLSVFWILTDLIGVWWYLIVVLICIYLMTSGPITSRHIDGETMETVTDFIFLGSKITEDDNCSHEIKRCLLLGRKAMTNLNSILKSRDITLPTKVHLVKAMVFSSSHVWMWELDHKESLAPKNWCFWTVVLEKTLENPLDCKEIKSVNPKGNQS